MIELTLLGAQSLRGANGQDLSSLPAQPKRFSLLAYLALAPGLHRRDSLAAIFWPDLDQFAARRALRNTLYHLRDALGDGVIVAQGDEAIGIEPAALVTDVGRLEQAVAAGRYRDALDLFRGELLAGIHFANAGEAFEQWLSTERHRITELVLRAIDGLGQRDKEAGDLAAAGYWAERAVALVPDDESRLRRAMGVLDAAGDTGGVFRLYDAYAKRLAAEYGAAPSAETEALARAIRVRRAAAPSAPIEPGEIVEASPIPPTRRRRYGWLALVGAGLFLLGAIAARASWRSRVTERPARARVLVTVFDDRTGVAALKPIGRMAQDWLARGLVQTNLVDVVDPRAVFVQSQPAMGSVVDPVVLARRTGASLAVTGSYDVSGDTLFVQATLMDVGSRRIVRAVGPVLSTVRSPVAALEELRSRVMSALATAVTIRANVNLDRQDEIPTFDAYQSYVEGWDAFWHGDGRGSESLFLDAARRDSTFTPAALAAAMAAANSNDCPLVDSLSDVLDHRRPVLGRVDRLSLAIADARCHGRNEELLRLTLERADLEPDRAGDQMSAASAALWANRPNRAIQVLERVNPETDLAWSTDTTHSSYWGAMAEALHLLGRHEAELELTDKIPLAAPLTRIWIRGSALAALSRPTATLALLDSALALPVETASDIGLAPFTDGRPQYTVTAGWVANWIAKELAVHGDTVAARQAAARALAWYRGRPADERNTFEERLVASWSLELLGSYPEAEAMARGLVLLDSTNVDFRGALASVAAERGDTALAASLDRWLAAQPVARVSWSTSIYRARIAAVLGQPDSALARLREAFDRGIWPRWLHQEPALVTLEKRPEFIALVHPRD